MCSIVKNSALNKDFYYCREHKKECNELDFQTGSCEDTSFFGVNTTTDPKPLVTQLTARGPWWEDPNKIMPGTILKFDPHVKYVGNGGPSFTVGNQYVVYGVGRKPNSDIPQEITLQDDSGVMLNNCLLSIVQGYFVFVSAPVTMPPVQNLGHVTPIVGVTVTPAQSNQSGAPTYTAIYLHRWRSISPHASECSKCGVVYTMGVPLAPAVSSCIKP